VAGATAVARWKTPDGARGPPAATEWGTRSLQTNPEELERLIEASAHADRRERATTLVVEAIVLAAIAFYFVVCLITFFAA